MANTGLTLDIAGIICGLEKRDLFVMGSIVNLPTPCGEKLFSRVTVWKGGYGGKYKVINCGWAWNCDCSVILLGIMGPLHWFGYGVPQNHIQWGWSGPQRTSFWVPWVSTTGLSNSPPPLGLPHPKIWMVFISFQLYHPLKRHLL